MGEKSSKKPFFFNGKKRLVSAAVMGTLIGSSISSAVGWGAGLNDALNGMLIASAGPQIAQSQQAMVLQGGYGALRIPDQSYNVVSFAPPNLSMGCGGINLFLGSFSFINAQQFVQMLKQIGEGLAVVAFQTALSTMCAHCMDILNYLQQAMQDMNNAMRGYCEAGSGFSIANFTQSMEKAGSAFTNLMDAATGQSSGFTSSLAGQQTQPGNGFQSLLSNEENATMKYFGEPYQSCTLNANGSKTCTTVAASTSSAQKSISDASLLPDLGNFTWRSMLNSQAQTLLAGVTKNTTTAMEMVMSLVGTTVALPPKTGQLGTQAPKGTATDYSVDIGLHELKVGGNNAQMLTCEADPITINGKTYNFPQFGVSGKPYSQLSCLLVNKESLSAAGFVPIDSYVKMMMEGPGAQNVSNDATYHRGLIAAVEAQNQGSAALTANEQQFVEGMNWPVLALMVQAWDAGPAGQALVPVIGTSFEKPLEAAIDAKYLLAIQNVLDNIDQSHGKIPQPKNLNAVLANLNRDMASDEKEIEKGNVLYQQYIQQINEMKMGHPFVSGSGK